MAAAFMTAAAAGAAVPENAYLIGGATSAQWKTQYAPQMQKEGNTFTFEGNLVNGELKILTERKFECATFHPADGGREVNKTGIQNETVNYYSGGPDNKWNVTVPGKYRITLNVAENPGADNGGTISFEYLGEYTIPDQVFLVGTGSLNGWSTDDLVEMTRNGNVFTYEGILVGSESGEELKFLTGHYFECRNYYAPQDGSVIDEDGIENQTVNYAGADNKWKVKKTGYYRLTLTLNPEGTQDNAGTLSAEYIKNPPTYMLGLAAGKFVSNEAVAMTKNQNGTYSWEGTLDYDTTDGDNEHANKQFKFCFPTGDWNRVIFLVPESATGAGVTPVAEGTHNLKQSYEFGGQKVTDAFFGINPGMKGKYKITVDPAALTMTLAKDTDTGVRSVAVEAEGVEEAYDLNGVKVDLQNAPAGVYIVRKGGTAKKVMIK